MKGSEIKRQVAVVLDLHQIRHYRFEHKGSKHPKIVFEHGGREHKIPYPGSPGDRRALLNQLASVKQYLRKIDVKPTFH